MGKFKTRKTKINNISKNFYVKNYSYKHKSKKSFYPEIQLKNNSTTEKRALSNFNKITPVLTDQTHENIFSMKMF